MAYGVCSNFLLLVYMMEKLWIEKTQIFLIHLIEGGKVKKLKTLLFGKKKKRDDRKWFV